MRLTARRIPTARGAATSAIIHAARTFSGGKTVGNVEALDILTYDGSRMRVGATSDDDMDLIQRSGGRRAELYANLKALAGRYGDETRVDARKYPVASPATISTIRCPKKAFTWHALWLAPKAPAR